MNKSEAIDNINSIYEAWKKGENFPKNIQDLSLDDLPFSFRKKISKQQEKFLNALITLNDEIWLSNIKEKL